LASGYKFAQWHILELMHYPARCSDNFMLLSAAILHVWVWTFGLSLLWPNFSPDPE